MRVPRLLIPAIVGLAACGEHSSVAPVHPLDATIDIKGAVSHATLSISDHEAAAKRISVDARRWMSNGAIAGSRLRRLG
jgi:hypothetical protein